METTTREMLGDRKQMLFKLERKKPKGEIKPKSNSALGVGRKSIS